MKAWAFKNPAKFIVAFLGGCILAALLLVSLGNRLACSWYGNVTERDTRYTAFVGCMVKTQHGWVPRHELRTAAQ